MIFPVLGNNDSLVTNIEDNPSAIALGDGCRDESKIVGPQCISHGELDVFRYEIAKIGCAVLTIQ